MLRQEIARDARSSKLLMTSDARNTPRGRSSENKRHSVESNARAREWRMQDCHVPGASK